MWTWDRPNNSAVSTTVLKDAMGVGFAERDVFCVESIVRHKRGDHPTILDVSYLEVST